MELYNRNRFLYDAVIVGILNYIVEVILSHILEQPDILLLAAGESNKGRGFITFSKFTVLDSNDIVNDIVNGFSQVLKFFFNFYLSSVSYGSVFAELLE